MTALFVLLTLTLAAAADDLSALQDEAASANPSLAAQEALVRELANRAAVSGAWMDPVLAVEYSNAPIDTFGLASHPMSGLQLKLQQSLAPPGWSGRKRAIGERMSDAAGHGRAEIELQLRAAVARAWWNLVQTRLLEEVTRAHIARTEELQAAVTSRYEVGAAGQSAVLRLEVLRGRLTDELLEFEAMDRSLSAALDGALSREGPTTWETPDTVEPIAPPEASAWPVEAIERPGLAVIDAKEAAEAAGAAAAKLDALPDPSVWIGYRVRLTETETDPGTDFVSAGIGVPLPVGSGRRAHGERDARLEAASRMRSERARMVDEITAGYRATQARWSRAHHKAITYAETLVPAATNALAATQTDFAVDRAGFAELFEAEVTLLDLERARIRASVETHLQHADATALLGVSPTGGQ